MRRTGLTLAIGVALAFCILRAGRAADAPPAVQQVPPDTAEAILGRNVIDANSKPIGRLIDVLVDANGQPEAAVIEFGGFMGVGNRKVAVHWSALRFNPGDGKRGILLEMTPDQIKAAPEYRSADKPAPVVTPAPTGQSAPPAAPNAVTPSTATSAAPTPPAPAQPETASTAATHPATGDPGAIHRDAPTPDTTQPAVTQPNTSNPATTHTITTAPATPPPVATPADTSNPAASHTDTSAPDTPHPAPTRPDPGNPATTHSDNTAPDSNHPAAHPSEAIDGAVR